MTEAPAIFFFFLDIVKWKPADTSEQTAALMRDWRQTPKADSASHTSSAHVSQTWRCTVAPRWESAGNSSVAADSISLLTKLISQCSPSGRRSAACSTPGDVKQSKCGSTTATKMGHDGQRLAITASHGFILDLAVILKQR